MQDIDIYLAVDDGVATSRNQYNSANASIPTLMLGGRYNLIFHMFKNQSELEQVNPEDLETAAQWWFCVSNEFHRNGSSRKPLLLVTSGIVVGGGYSNSGSGSGSGSASDTTITVPILADSAELRAALGGSRSVGGLYAELVGWGFSNPSGYGFTDKRPFSDFKCSIDGFSVHNRIIAPGWVP